MVRGHGHVVGAAVVDPNVVGEFDQLVRPLERRTGKRLGEPGRSKCLRAMAECPEGFRALVADAERRASRNPVRLLLTMVAAGDHRAVEGEAA